MTGILMLDSLTRGNTLKQGDKTPLTYKLLDADGDNLNVAGKTATVRLAHPNYLTIGYEKTGLTVQSDDTVTFTIDKIIPARKYHVEIIVDNKFVFPSRSVESKFTIDKSSLGTESNIIEIVGKDVLIRTVKSQVDTELQPLVTSMEAARQAEAQRASVESSRVSAEKQREIDHANRSAELAGKADKVVVKNELANPNFSNGLDGWSTSVNSEAVVNGNEVTITTTERGKFGLNLSYHQEGMKYISAEFYSEDETTSFTLGSTGVVTTPPNGVWTRVSTINSDKGIIRFYADSGVDKHYKIRKPTVINLTQTFGEGNEPTKKEMDRLIEITGYIDGEYALNNKEMLNYLMDSDKLVLKNLISNGNFSNEGQGWGTGANVSSITFGANYVEFEGLGSAAEASANWVFHTPNVPPSAGDILYTCSLVTRISGKGNVYIGVGYSTSTGNIPLNDKKFVSYRGVPMFTPSGNNRNVILSADIGVTTRFESVVYLNLTKIFGAGNEPTKEEMDNLINTTGYISSEHTLSDKEMLSYLMDGKANKKQEDWITPTLMNGWTTVDNYSEPGYMKDEFGFVHVRGTIKSGAGPVFQLPMGYRSTKAIVFPTVDFSEFGRLTLDGVGNIIPNVKNKERVSIHITFKT